MFKNRLSVEIGLIEQRLTLKLLKKWKKYFKFFVGQNSDAEQAPAVETRDDDVTAGKEATDESAAHAVTYEQISEDDVSSKEGENSIKTEEDGTEVDAESSFARPAAHDDVKEAMPKDYRH